MCSLVMFETVIDESKRTDIVRTQYDYVTTKVKEAKAVLRVKFLESCFRSNLIPRFLQKFTFPRIDAYSLDKVERFQRQILKDEIGMAKDDVVVKERRAQKTGDMLWKAIPPDIDKVDVEMRLKSKVSCEINKIEKIHEKKLNHLSEQQEKPLWKLKENTYKLIDVEEKPPEFVLNFISRGPRYPIRDKFDKMAFLAEMDRLIEHAEGFTGPVDDIINQINIKACQYVKSMEKVKEDEECNRVRKWLKDNEIKAVPFDKGCGFALMSDKGYEERIDKILKGTQFKVKKLRANSRPIELVEQDRINKILDDLHNQQKIPEDMKKFLKLRGGQLPKLYGLAKIHKPGVPVRPILSMSGSMYENVGKLVSEWLGKIPEAKINCTSKTVTNLLRKGKQTLKLRPGRRLVSYDVWRAYIQTCL